MSAKAARARVKARKLAALQAAQQEQQEQQEEGTDQTINTPTEDQVVEGVSNLTVSDSAGGDDDLLDQCFDEVDSEVNLTTSSSSNTNDGDNNNNNTTTATTVVEGYREGDGKGDEAVEVVPVEMTEEEKEKKREEKLKAYRRARFRKKGKGAAGPKADKTIDNAGADKDNDDELKPDPEPAPAPAPPAADPSGDKPKRKFRGIAAVRREKNRLAAAQAAAAAPAEPVAVAPIPKKKRGNSRRTAEGLSIFLLLAAGYVIGFKSLLQSSEAGMLIVDADSGRRLSVGGVDSTGDEGDGGEWAQIKRRIEKPLGAGSEAGYGSDLDVDAAGDIFSSVASFLHRAVMAVLSLPLSFLPRTVPTFLVVALAVRLTCYALFNATGLPPTPKSETDSYDLIGKAKEMAMGMFPKVFLAYNVYQTVVSDVLMVFFGVLLAMATFEVEGGGRHG
eukprot:CAMPEP_0182453088 /NCGR_PEP_ID=MMETSP1319-20130603/301_1 /TAXON_ID=172717 /ORGANISM="Bolidomonas pacifica, Strain RCC208" /LENGTH=446 /DNA_ID=CAMNT_0024650979 /DNA_START=150 /DNA_END=1486 /DNA_ORIENTATION=-